MKHGTFLRNALLMVLSFVILVNATVPFTMVNADVASTAPTNPKQQFSNWTTPPKASVVAVLGTVFTGITLAIRGIGAIKYAIENKDVSDASWTDVAMSYFSGNTANDSVEDMHNDLKREFAMTNESIKELEGQISTLQEDIAKLSASLGDSIEAKDLKSRLDDFYTNFFMPAYTNLITAYHAVGNALENESTNEATLRAKLDDLYMKANELKRLDSYITGTAFFDNSGILDTYYNYMLKANGTVKGETDKYYEIANSAQEFTMKLFAASALQKLCTAYVSSYQLHYYYEHYDEMVESNDFVGYIVGGTSNLSTNKLTEYEIKENISHAYTDSQVISGEVAKNLNAIHMLDSFVGYVENNSVYYAPVNSSKVAVYSGATYHLFAIPEELESVFQEDFSFVSDNSDVVLSTNGVFTYSRSVQTSFKISYVYGKDTLENPITIYEITFVPTTRVFEGGYGHEKSPYLISNSTQLKDFASNSNYHKAGVHVRLTNDINLTGIQLPKISEYYGVFDGNGYKLYGTLDNYVVFNTNRGTIKNLTISDANLNFSNAGSSIGGIIAIVNSGNIINCHVKKSSMTLYSHNHIGGSQGYTSFSATIGGIVAQNSGTIEYCSVTDNTRVKAETSSRELYEVGGDKIWDDQFWDDGTTTFMNVNIGGIAGENSGRVRNCFVGNSTLTSTIYAAYYKVIIVWDTTVNKVDATIRYGNIVGSNSGESVSNFYSNVSNNTSIKKIAGNPNRKDDSLVTERKNEGIRGTNGSSPNAYFTSISVSACPMQEKYLKGEKFNFAGLKVVDNMGNAVYGYTVNGFTSVPVGKRTISLSYKDLSTSFAVEGGCEHKHIRIDDKIPPTCTEDGIGMGVFCLTCNKYLDGRQTISKGEEYCYDGDGNHKCDFCDKEVSVCFDDDQNHLCDLCGVEVSKCIDFDDHICDLCGAEAGKCTDSDDHFCDICGLEISACADTDDHLCDICNKKLSDCVDTDRNYRCDICGKNLCSCKDDNDDHFCDICKFRLNYCYDDNLNHVCDICSAVVCTDSDKNHACDICASVMGIHIAAGNNTHLCDYCGERASECVDADLNHTCEICQTMISEHKNVEGGHNCGYCGQQVNDCIDSNNDHICDICNKQISQCNVKADSHTCSVCEKAVSQCIDANNDHSCDICRILLTDHEDLNEDAKCDVCGLDMKNKMSQGTVIIIVAASTVGAGGLGVGLWWFLRKRFF